MPIFALVANLHKKPCEFPDSTPPVVRTFDFTRYRFIEISLAQRGCPWENGYAERLIRTLKEEEVHLNAYEDITQARARIGHFITQVYHQKRPHSALRYLTTVKFEQQHLS